MVRVLVVPDSWGSLIEGNPCHLPAGRPDGGQFCSTEPGSLYLEPPKAKEKMGRLKRTDLSSVDVSGSERAVERELGISDVGELAGQMVSKVENELFRVEADVHGAHDDTEKKKDKDAWKKAKNKFVKNFYSFLEDPTLHNIYEEVVDELGISTTDLLARNTTGGSELVRLMVGRLVNDRGELQSDWGEVREWLRRNLNNLESGEYSIPSTLADGFIPNDLVRQFPGFDDWDGGSTTNLSQQSVRLSLRFFGDKGTRISRTFKKEGDSLIVHHNFFKVAEGRQGDGVARQVLASSLEAYENFGVSKIETLANIDVGSYAWARYGFVPRSGVSVASKIRTRLEELVTSGVVTKEEADHIGRLIRPNDPTFVWDISDARIATTGARASQAIKWFKTVSSSIYNSKTLKIEAKRGVINVGRMLLANLSWDAVLNLKDTRQRARLAQYVGI